MRAEACRSCGAAVVWAIHPRTKRPAPIDATAAPDGHFVLIELEGGDVVYRKPGPDELELPRHVSHFATCPQAANWRGR